MKWRIWRRTKRDAVEGPESTLAHLAVLLGAGLSPDRAWEELAVLGGSGSVPDEVVHLRRSGRSLAESIEAAVENQAPSWRTVGMWWEVARVSGAPLGPALRSLARSLRDQERTRREVDAELAAPRATMRLVTVLPLVSLAAGALGGVDTLSFLFLTSPGRVSLATGVACLVLAWWWMRVMVLRTVSQHTPPSPRADAFVIAISGGGSPEMALRRVDQVMAKYSLDIPGDDGLEDVISLSRRAGVPVAGLAAAQADYLRDVSRTQASASVGTLSVRLVIPLGLLVLPAFVLIAIVPMAWGIWSQGTAL